MHRLFLCAVLVALCLAPMAAFADTLTHEAAGVEIWFPDGWKTEADGDMLTVTAADDSIVIIAGILEAEDLDAAVDALTTELDGMLTDVKLDGDAEEIDVNGLKGVALDGKAKADGTPVDFSIGIFASPKDKALMILAFAEDGAFKKHEKDLDKVLHSLKPAN